ncbi:MAG: hypothetical protein Kow0037_01350 [Calditrichia bacterium]
MGEVMDGIKRLLIVDDEETLTFSLYQTFIKAPIECEVVTASDGNQALEKIQKESFDLVITDIAMPGLSGLELLSIIKRKNPTTKVVIITAYGSDEREEFARKQGAEKYIEKPFDIHQIRDIVFQLLND